MNTEEFFNRMKEISKQVDEEYRHINADWLMCELLEELGFKDGVDIFINMEKGYYS